MKNFFKTRFVSVFGIIAIVTVIGFSMIACDGGGGGGGGGDTYAGIMGRTNNSSLITQFNTTFSASASTSDSTLKYVAGDPQTLKTKLESLPPADIEAADGLSISQIRTNMANVGVPSEVINAVITKLEADGYVLAYAGFEGYVVFCAGIKE